MLKKTLALFLCLLLFVSGSVMAFAADNAQTITGDVDIINPTFVVSVPLNLNFSLDPLKIKGQSQIFSGDTSYNIVNKTTVPVKVDFALKITATTGVTFKNATEAVTNGELVTTMPSGGTPIDKDIYVAVHGAKSIDTTKLYDASKGTITTPSGGNLSATTVSGNVVPVYATAAATTNILNFQTAAGQVASGNFSFLVDAGVADTTSTTTAADATKNKPTATSMTSFRLYSLMNTYADWDASDFTFEGSYNFIGVAQDDYDLAMTGGGVGYSGFMLDATEAPALVKAVSAYSALAQPPAADYTFQPGTLTTGTINTGLTKASVWSATDPLIIKFDSANKPTSINALAATTTYLSSAPWTSGTHYVYNQSTGVLTVKQFSSSSNTLVFRINSSSGAVITLSFS